MSASDERDGTGYLTQELIAFSSWKCSSKSNKAAFEQTILFHVNGRSFTKTKRKKLMLVEQKIRRISRVRKECMVQRSYVSAESLKTPPKPTNMAEENDDYFSCYMQSSTRVGASENLIHLVVKF